jgi:hypothetical protein
VTPVFKLGLWRKDQTAKDVSRAEIERVKALTRAILALPEDATVSANEIICADPACPGSETVVLVMIPGQRTKAYKVQAPMAEVTEVSLRAAMAG